MTTTEFDLARGSLRDLNAALHAKTQGARAWRVLNPRGRHAVAVGLDDDVQVSIEGHVGYYCGGMNKAAAIVIHGNAGVGVAENMMSGRVHVRGDVSQSAGASARGGLLVVEGSAGARCGIALKGADIVVRGNVGHMSAFMAQRGCLVVLGDAGESLGDSLYEARLYVRGTVKSLGADCIEKPMLDEHFSEVQAKLDAAGVAGVSPQEFRRYGSARTLYHFHVDYAGAY